MVKASGVEYEINEAQDTISVPADSYHSIQMELASKGLPKSGTPATRSSTKATLASATLFSAPITQGYPGRVGPHHFLHGRH